MNDDNEFDPLTEPDEPRRPQRPMREARVRMTEIVMPNDTNPHGNISGGRVMHLIDIAAAVAAMRHARKPVVTVSFDDVVFHAPIPLGHIVLLDSQVTFVGRTSIEAKVVVRGENPLTGERRHTTTAYVTFVGLDDVGRPAVVPELTAETPEETATLDRARRRREERLARHERS